MGLALLCPTCFAPLIVRNCSDLPKPEGERWDDYDLVDGEPVEVVERGESHYAGSTKTEDLDAEDLDESEAY